MKTASAPFAWSAADGNPYLALGEPIVGNAYDVPVAPESALPTTLWNAARRLKASDAARSLFDPALAGISCLPVNGKSAITAGLAPTGK